MARLRWGVCGEIAFGGDPRDHPQTFLRNARVQQLLLELNRRVSSSSYVRKHYPDLTNEIAGMARLGMLREGAATLSVGFTLLDAADQRLLWQVSEWHARRLAELLFEVREEVQAALAPLATRWVSLRQLAFLVIGCYLLDWGALRVLAVRGVISEPKPQAGGNRYTLWAEVEGAFPLRAVYWGGHSLLVGDWLLHTFGDHAAETKRLTMPDTLDLVHDGELPGRAAFRALQREQNAELGRELAGILSAIGRSGCPLARLSTMAGQEQQASLRHRLELLRAWGYLAADGQEVVLQVPLFADGDADNLRRALTAAQQALQRWIAADFGTYRAELSALSPVRNGVDFPEVMVQCWHYLFGLTNRCLVEQGLLCDTYDAQSRWQGYLPGMAKASLLRELGVYPPE